MRSKQELSEYLMHQFGGTLLSNTSITQKCKALLNLGEWWEKLTSNEKDGLYAILPQDLRDMMERYWAIPKPSPSSFGCWKGVKGEGTFYFDNDYVPAEKNTRNGMSWCELVEEYRKDFNLHCDGGIRYTCNRIDFSGYIVASVKIRYEDCDLTRLRNRGGSDNTIQERAVLLFEQTLSNEIAKGGYSDFWEYKDGMCNGVFVRNTPLVIHEDYDGETLCLVPKYLHDNWKHYGGVSLVAAILGL